MITSCGQCERFIEHSQRLLLQLRCYLHLENEGMRINDSSACAALDLHCIRLPLGAFVVAATLCPHDLLVLQSTNNHVVSRRWVALAAALLPLKPETCRADGALAQGEACVSTPTSAISRCRW